MTSRNENITVGVLQPAYLPWLGFFDQIANSDIFVLYDDVQFEKGGWQNRNRIKGTQGTQWLTVPVNTSGFRLIKDITIASNKWVKKHVKSIEQNYKKASFFEYTKPLLVLLQKKEWKFLLDLNLELLHFIVELLDIKTKIVLSSTLNVKGNRIIRLLNILKAFNATRFIEGDKGKSYISIEEFKNKGVEVVFQEYTHPIYTQLHGKFISHLSIIDLLCNCGPNSLQILNIRK